MDNDFEIVGMEICDMKNTYYLKPTGRYEINKRIIKKYLFLVPTLNVIIYFNNKYTILFVKMK